MEKQYYAKSEQNGIRVSVSDHLHSVSEIAEKYGSFFEFQNAARIAGLFHDFGKYSEAFQSVLQGTRQGVDHAVCGAVILWRLSRADQKSPQKTQKALIPVIEAVNGHHAGLMDFALLRPYLEKILAGKNVCPNAGRESALLGRALIWRPGSCFSGIARS